MKVQVQDDYEFIYQYFWIDELKKHKIGFVSLYLNFNHSHNFLDLKIIQSFSISHLKNLNRSI